MSGSKLYVLIPTLSLASLLQRSPCHIHHPTSHPSPLDHDGFHPLCRLIPIRRLTAPTILHYSLAQRRSQYPYHNHEILTAHLIIFSLQFYGIVLPTAEPEPTTQFLHLILSAETILLLPIMPPPYKKAAVTNKKKSPQKNQTAPSHSHNQRKSPRKSCGSGSLPPPESGISSSGQINGNTNPPIVNASDAPTNEAHTTDHASGNTTTPPPPLFYGTNPDLESFYRDRHRLAYNEAAFAVANAEVAAGKKDNRVCKQQHELQRIIDCVSYWNKMDSKVKESTASLLSRTLMPPVLNPLLLLVNRYYQSAAVPLNC